MYIDEEGYLVLKVVYQQIEGYEPIMCFKRYSIDTNTGLFKEKIGEY